MKISFYKFLSFSAFILVVFSSIGIGQVTSSTSSSQTTTPEIAKALDAVNKVLDDAGVSFKQGLQEYIDNHPQTAGEKFNKSVEVFLYSTLNIQKDQRLQACYDQLIETVYRIEFPTETQLPQVRNLSYTCNWNIDNSVADNIIKLWRPAANKAASDVSTVASAAGSPSKPADIKVGFNSQEFEPSPLDELSKLQLTTE